MLLAYFALTYQARRELAKLPYSKYRPPILALKFLVGASHRGRSGGSGFACGR